jgi:hypothetical protein
VGRAVTTPAARRTSATKLLAKCMTVLVGIVVVRVAVAVAANLGDSGWLQVVDAVDR